MRLGKRCEASEQATVIDWCKRSEGAIPELRLLYHIPNGGSRNGAEAANLKRQGVKSGVPDLHWPVARGAYIGLWIEMKYDKGDTSDNQDVWLLALQKAGHCVFVCYSADAAIRIISEYNRLGPEQALPYPVNEKAGYPILKD